MLEYIERETVHSMMVGLTRYKWTSPVSNESHVTVDADDVNFGIDKIPAADVKPVRHGRWLDGRCTACGWEEPDECIYEGYETAAWEETPYCPKCGAKMDLGG